MNEFLATVAHVNDVINNFVWVKIGLILLLGTGIIMTCLTGFFQVSLQTLVETHNRRAV